MPDKIEISVAQLPQLLPTDWISSTSSDQSSSEPTLAIVIDTLRFTSTVCVALQAGAASVSIAAEVETARRLADQIGPGTLLCGERHCHRIEGFQLGNSPSEYSPANVASRNLVFSTTNGTRAVAAAAASQQIVLASILNRQAVVEWIRTSPYKRVWVLCAGTDGQIATEDVFTAGAILSQLREQSLLANDSAVIALKLFESVGSDSSNEFQQHVIELLSHAAGGLNLIQSGYRSDLAAVAQIDSIGVVPRNSVGNPNRFIR